MEERYWFLIIGIVIGWITKFPLLLKWYNELKATRDYEKAMRYKRYTRLLKKLHN
jgi:hypothetical protein